MDRYGVGSLLWSSSNASQCQWLNFVRVCLHRFVTTNCLCLSQGGLYYAAAVLAPPGWGPLAAWLTGWSNYIVQVTGAPSVDYGTVRSFWKLTFSSVCHDPIGCVPCQSRLQCRKLSNFLPYDPCHDYSRNDILYANPMDCTIQLGRHDLEHYHPHHRYHSYPGRHDKCPQIHR